MKENKKKNDSRMRIGVIFGGRSAEHQVSLVSATSIINALDTAKYEVLQIGITPDGRWVSSPEALANLKREHSPKGKDEHALLPDPTRCALVKIGGEKSLLQRAKIDVIIPILHGSFGEDGTMQGLLELAAIPYVGAGVIGSAVGMDKVITKQLCEHEGIPVAPYLWFLSSEYRRERSRLVAQIESRLRYPVFVKPANSGSSVGITKAHDRRELKIAIALAATYDRKILVEKSIEQAREIEVSVLGNDTPTASLPGEIVSSNEFYDYDAKYIDGKSAAIIPAKLSQVLTKRIQAFALSAFRAIDCAGMARVDFLVTRKSGKVYFNEVNTIPGFTSISMYPKLWEASGIPYPELLDRLIQLAVERFQAKQMLQTTFQPKRKWFTE